MKLLLVLSVLALMVTVLGQGFSQMRRPMPMRRAFPQRPPQRFGFQRGPMGPPRTFVPQSNFGGMPGLRPPKGIAEQLNRAKLKDFMSLGQFLMHRRRALQR